MKQNIFTQIFYDELKIMFDRFTYFLLILLERWKWR